MKKHKRIIAVLLIAVSLFSVFRMTSNRAEGKATSCTAKKCDAEGGLRSKLLNDICEVAPSQGQEGQEIQELRDDTPEGDCNDDKIILIVIVVVVIIIICWLFGGNLGT